MATDSVYVPQLFLPRTRARRFAYPHHNEQGSGGVLNSIYRLDSLSPGRRRKGKQKNVFDALVHEDYNLYPSFSSALHCVNDNCAYAKSKLTLCVVAGNFFNNCTLGKL